MIIIADCGGTKSDWALVCDDRTVVRMQTGGINPIHQSEDDIVKQLDAVVQEVTHRRAAASTLDIYFYGAGCNAVGTGIVSAILARVFAPFAPGLHVWSDLLGAARSLCQHAEGIACILGTGSNSCLYDGESIAANTPPLGYILGDEGSGADLGKHFLHDLLKGQLPEQLRNEFYSSCQLSYPQVIQRIYQQPRANSFLASLAPLIHRHLDNQQVYDMVLDRFRSFVRYNLKPYRRPDLPVSFVGSVAYYFRDLLTEAIEREGLKIGTVARTPMAGLLAYHGVDAADV